MPHFPRTATAYQFAIEYCTLQRILEYQEAYFAAETGRPTHINTKLKFKNTLSSFHSMADEVRLIMKGEYKFIKEKVISALKEYVAQDNLINFRVCAAMIIENYNAQLDIKLIQTGEVLSDYFKDGFIVAHDFISTAQHLIDEFPDFAPRPASVVKRIEAPVIKTMPKIKTPLTVGQLAYMFRLFHDTDLMPRETLYQIAQYLAASFTTKRTSEIDVENAYNLVSSPNKKDAEKVADWLKDLMIKARNFHIKPAE